MTKQVQKKDCKETWDYYQTRLMREKQLPNFWMSLEFMEKADITNKMGFVLLVPDSSFGDFLDYQYIYDPKNFLDLSGGTWKVFRKNIRKYPDRVGEFNLEYRKLSPREFEKDIEELVLNWGEGRDLYDVEALVRYAFQGENRYALLRHGKVVGLNIFDENFKFINYRYCIDDGTPFLNEYMRYLFYTSDEILKKQKLVNDGGSLDNEGLRKFKLRLNPVHIGYVYSYS